MEKRKINRLQDEFIEEVEKEKSVLTKTLYQSQNKIEALEKEVKDSKVELKTEKIANEIMLNKAKEKIKVFEKELEQKETTNVKETENANLKQEISAKEQRIQELTEQLEKMTKILENDLTGQIEFSPKNL
jgi:hypothetical protein